jgi:hypothetical protein
MGYLHRRMVPGGYVLSGSVVGYNIQETPLPWLVGEIAKARKMRHV